MPTVRRYDDRAELKLDAKRTPQGFLRCDATIARTGVQVYRLPDGSVRREYRPPEEVFKADALASFALAPVTLGHPSVPVTADNAKTYSVGMIADAPEAADGRFVRTKSLVITDAFAISEAESGKAAQVSCGYECDLDMTPGVTPDGEKYDAVQRSIRGNHVALVPVGRAGPEVRLRLDAHDNAVPDGAQPQKEMSMEKMIIDGVEVEVSATAAQLIRKDQKARADALAAAEKARADAEAKAKTDAEAAAKALADAKADADKQKARADAAEEAKAKAEKARADAEDPKRIAEAVKTRVALEKQVSVLAPKVKTDGLTDKELKLAALKELGVKTEGKSDAYCDARFDGALEEAAKVNPAAKALAGFIGTPEQQKADEEKARADADAADPRKKFMAEQTAAAQKMGQPAQK